MTEPATKPILWGYRKLLGFVLTLSFGLTLALRDQLTDIAAWFLVGCLTIFVGGNAAVHGARAMRDRAPVLADILGLGVAEPNEDGGE